MVILIFESLFRLELYVEVYLSLKKIKRNFDTDLTASSRLKPSRSLDKEPLKLKSKQSKSLSAG